ncbi:MAG TPA: thiopeptide-type bacteriocin biosynthesis protein [Daejeonella sp.]|uniref:thiopeptide-type bacteriocin biosynthesis protein n=1 Tax=Daejeonella sp. TaxID=2805397 RepID=UPI002ED7E4DD
MNYDLNSRIILRVPRFPVNNASQTLDELLQNPVFRDALYLASDAMSDELKRCDFQLSQCTEKMKLSLMKYHKRICYRPTPFGAFAALALIKLKESKDSGILINQQSFQTLVVEKDILKTSVNFSSGKCYRINPFIYPYGTDFRILRKIENAKLSTFSISEIFGSDAIINLLSGKQIISQSSLFELLQKSGVVMDDLAWYLNELLELQIILPHQPGNRNFPCPLIPEHKMKPGSAYDSYCSVSVDGTLPMGLKEQVHDALFCIEKLSSQAELETLTNFKRRFKKLFDRKEVPLLQALDPELGIDYEGLSMPVSEKGKIQDSIPWSPLHELLLGKWTSQTGTAFPRIEILEDDLKALDNSQKNYPPAYSMMFSVIGEHLQIKAAGGVSSLNMIGRFTVIDPDILKFGRALAKKEMEMNPDVLFAEITHLDSVKNASVINRAVLYDYQIPFFESPEVSDDYVISLNDLYLTLVDDGLQLWSVRLKKRIIPRFSCAYNYQNSPLPVFRFLCDLQHEGFIPNLNFSMADLFPGLPAYPRVIYKGLILEAASWHLNAKNLSGMKHLDQPGQFAAFNSYAMQIGLPDEICYEVHDHLLHLKLSSSMDVSLLLNTIPSSGRIVFREYDNRLETLVKDKQGNSYTHECIAFITNLEKSYSAFPEPLFPDSAYKDKLFPFDEWLYIKLYLHPSGYEDLLLNYIQPFISENTRKGNISTWFFISYLDEESHLRLRLKQMPGREAKLLKSYRKLENILRYLPNLKKLDLSTYIREQERYNPIGIEPAEDLFGLSSEIVLSGLDLPFMDDPKRERLFQAIRHLLMVFKGLKFDLSLVHRLSMNFSRHLTKNQTIEFDLEFREDQRDLRSFLKDNSEMRELEKQYVNKIGMVTHTLSINEQIQVITDLNHMHLNRHYLHDQQFFEAKSYYFLAKIARSMINYQGV